MLDQIALFFAMFGGSQPSTPPAFWVHRVSRPGESDLCRVQLEPRLAAYFDVASCSLKSVEDPQGVLLRSDPNWKLREGNALFTVKPIWRGYRFESGSVKFLYHLPVKGGVALLTESPQSASTEKQTRLRREFEVSGLPAGSTISLTVPVPSGQQDQIQTNGALTDEEAGQLRLTLRAKGTTFFEIALPQPRSGDQRPQPAGDNSLPLPKLSGNLTLEPLAALPSGCYPTGLGRCPDGSVLVATRGAEGAIYRVQKQKARRVAAGMGPITGFWSEGKVAYALQDRELTRLTDLDGDGTFDEYWTVARGWSLGSGLHGLQPMGDAFLTSSAQQILTIGRNGAVAPSPGTWNAPSDVFTFGGKSFVWESFQGGVGMFPVDRALGSTPSAWVPYTGLGANVSTFVASAQHLVVAAGEHLYRVFPARSWSVECGAIPDGKVSFLPRANGPTLTTWGGLSQLSLAAKVHQFEIEKLTPMRNGLSIQLSESLAEGCGTRVDDYELLQLDPGETTPRKLTCSSVSLNRWRNVVFLATTLKPKTVVRVSANAGLSSAATRGLIGTTAYVMVPEALKTEGQLKPQAAIVNALTPSEAKQGFQLLFNGQDTSELRAFKGEGTSGWQIIGDALRFQAKDGRSDLASSLQFANCEIKFEWRVQGTDSAGICLRTDPMASTPTQSGPCIELNSTNPGGIRDLFAATRGAGRPAGTWNESRIEIRGWTIAHWLNGTRVLHLNLASAQGQALLARSPYRQIPAWAKRKAGHIVFCPFGDQLWLRSIRVRRLP